MNENHSTQISSSSLLWCGRTIDVEETPNIFFVVVDLHIVTDVRTECKYAIVRERGKERRGNGSKRERQRVRE
jgi:hypothetical protein